MARKRKSNLTKKDKTILDRALKEHFDHWFFKVDVRDAKQNILEDIARHNSEYMFQKLSRNRVDIDRFDNRISSYVWDRIKKEANKRIKWK